MNDFASEPDAVRVQMLEAVRRVLDSGWYILGNECERFEREWARVCGVRHGIGVANGMDAIEISLRSLDIGPGDEVITTPMTAFATVLAIIRAGATPVLADIEAHTGLLSPESVQRCISPRTKALVVVHLYGQVRRMGDWCRLCQSAGIALIEDCAQAHSATLQGKCAGSFGDAAAFSFYPTKNLGTAGDGGIIVTNNDAVSSRARELRNYGQTRRYFHGSIGMNSRLDEVHAAMLQVRLRWLPSWTEQRRATAQRYHHEISNPHVQLLAPPEEPAAHVWHLFVVLCEHRDKLVQYLAERDVQTLVHYPVTVHRQEPCVDILRDPDGLGASERHAAECVSLPCHPQLSDAQVSAVIEAVNAFGK